MANAVRAASSREPGGADSWQRSSDSETWVPKCAGCLPAPVLPHRCQGEVRSFGGAFGGWCHCDAPACVESTHDIRVASRRRQREWRDAALAEWEESDRSPIDREQVLGQLRLAIEAIES